LGGGGKKGNIREGLRRREHKQRLGKRNTGKALAFSWGGGKRRNKTGEKIQEKGKKTFEELKESRTVWLRWRKGKIPELGRGLVGKDLETKER